MLLGSAKDLVLHLRRDTPDHAVRRLLGEAQILQRDLIPITKLEDCEPDLAEVVLRCVILSLFLIILSLLVPNSSSLKQL